ncbi:hypothetical protein [Vibrio phage vB_VpaP_SJSY21]|nr:hypothetical protein [Vibrio phage vB_VpaP_SJSY21]
MKLHKDSWHYKLNAKMIGEDSIYSRLTLCSYFWLTVLSLLLVVAIITAITCVTLMPISVIWAFGFGGLPSALKPFAGGGVAIIAVLALFSVLCLANKVFEKCSKVAIKAIVGREVKVKKPNIFKEYYIAHKSKVCPILEVVDEN